MRQNEVQPSTARNVEVHQKTVFNIVIYENKGVVWVEMRRIYNGILVV